MKLDRNSGKGKYAVIRLRKMPDDPGRRADVEHAMRILADNSMLVNGTVGGEHEHFVVMLKDLFSQAALFAYAHAAENAQEHEYAEDVMELANRAGPSNRYCRKPD